jgi:hypothetical protein
MRRTDKSAHSARHGQSRSASSARYRRRHDRRPGQRLLDSTSRFPIKKFFENLTPDATAQMPQPADSALLKGHSTRGSTTQNTRAAADALSC